MSTFKIPDDSDFLGIANFDTYNSFLSKDWDFEGIKERRRMRIIFYFEQRG